VGAYVRGAIDAGEVAVVIATAAHRAAFTQHLEAAGVDLDKAGGEGRLVLLDAQETLAEFLVDGRPDPTRFDSVIGCLIRSLSDAGHPVRAYGEMVGVLWDAGQVNAAIELEELWDGLVRRLPFSLYCAYPASSVDRDDHTVALGEVCRLHSEVIGRPPGRAETPGPGITSVQREFEPTADGPRGARRFVLDSLKLWGRLDLAADAALVVTELATNAVLHGKSRFTVDLSTLGDILRISVTDGGVALGRTWRVEWEPCILASSGRGLGMVAELASDWGADRLETGKVVWAELRCPA
jgi:hypothetical protein